MSPHAIYAIIAAIMGVIALATNAEFKALFLVGVTVFIGLEIYFAPTTIAHYAKKRNFGAILFLNLALGWTLVGWVVAMVWAMAKEDIVVAQAQAPAPMNWRPLPGEASKPSPADDLKDCPYCAEPVKKAAIKCKHCGSDLETQPST
jgi:hypothetical protein